MEAITNIAIGNRSCELFKELAQKAHSHNELVVKKQRCCTFFPLLKLLNISVKAKFHLNGNELAMRLIEKIFRRNWRVIGAECLHMCLLADCKVIAEKYRDHSYDCCDVDPLKTK